MFSKSKNRFLGLAVSIAFASAAQVQTVNAAVVSINEANLPINVSNQETAKAVSEQNKPANALVSPSRAKAVANTTVQTGSAGLNNSVSATGNTADAKFPTIPMQMRLFLQHKIALPFLLRQKYFCCAAYSSAGSFTSAKSGTSKRRF